MIISRCCKHELYVLIDYYVCGLCHRACDTMDATRLVKDYDNDARIAPEITELIVTA